MLQGDWQGLMSPCFRNLVSSGWIPFSASGFKVYCLFQGIFPQALILFLSGEHVLPFLALKYPRLQDLLVLSFLGVCLGEYFNDQQVGHLGLLIDSFSV